MISRKLLFVILTTAACAPSSPPSNVAPPLNGKMFDAIPAEPLPGNTLPLEGPMATLFITVSDRDTMAPVPARVIFRPTPGAGFADSISSGKFDVASPGAITGASVAPGVLGAPEGVLLYTGQGNVPVPPGTYQLIFTRGVEYEALSTKVTVVDGETKQVDATLDRTVDTRGWLATDLHTHSIGSYDAKLLLERRVVSMVTNGLEILVPTEHNAAVDFTQAIGLLGYGPDLVGQVIGDEFNFAGGHGGAYPVPFDPNKKDGGVPPWAVPCDGVQGGINCLQDVDAFNFMRNFSGGVAAIAIAHPYWPGSDLGYFTNVPWGINTINPPPAMLQSAGSFDAIEVLNGYWTLNEAIDAMRGNWFALLQAGHRVTALGNSDTHRINWVRAGFPRTWLRLPNDLPGDTLGTELAAAVKGQRAIASTGPFARVTVDGADIGDTVRPLVAGQVTIDVEIDAPAWIAVDEVRIFIGGALRRTIAVGDYRRPRFHESFTETISGDTFVVVEAEGFDPMPGDIVGEYAQGGGYQTFPRVIANPIYVDADGDDAWHPQSLSARSIPLPRRELKPIPVECDPRLMHPVAEERDGPHSPLDKLTPLLFE